MSIPMLARLIFLVIVISAGFINSNKTIFKISPKSEQGTYSKVLGAVEEFKDLSVLELDQLVNQLPSSDDSSRIPQKKGEVNFDLLAVSGVVIDCESQSLLFNKEVDKQVPIASLTKLLTTLVFLDHNPGWETFYKIRAEDRREGGKIYVYIGEEIKVKDLFYLSLVGSANTATMALVHSTGMSEEEFVQAMNDRTKEMDLKKTYFYDAVGLDYANISTAKEVAQFTQFALANKDISQATLTKKYEFYTRKGKKRVVSSTDVLLHVFPQNGIKIIGGKTGYIEMAGYCFAGKFINQDGNEIVSVILGGVDKNSRFHQTEELVEWVYESYQW